jgi:NitT/TauT family transport system substrate-binding protein
MNAHNKTRLGLHALLLGAFAALVFAYRYATDKPVPESGRTKVFISTIIYPGSIPLHVALRNGYFTEEGLDVELVPYSSGKEGLTAVLENKLDFCVVAELPVVLAVLDSKPVAIVGTIFSAERDHRLVARRDRNIRSPADLRGKTVGLAPGTTADLILELVLNGAELKRTDIRIVPMAAHDLPAAILNGTVDAVSTWEPYLDRILTGLDRNGIVFDGFDVQGIFTLNLNLATTKQRAEKQPELVEKVLRAVIRAERFIRAHPVETQRMAVQSTGLNAATVNRLWGGYRFEVRLDQSLMISLEDTARWVIRTGQIEAAATPDFSQNVFADRLAAIDRGAVRMIR